MPHTTTLLDMARNLLDLDNEMTIYAAEPWTAESPAMLADQEDDQGYSSAAAKEGMTYFIEVFIAVDFLRDWIKKQQPSTRELCKYLICCALDDWSSVMPDLERGRSDIKK